MHNQVSVFFSKRNQVPVYKYIMYKLNSLVTVSEDINFLDRICFYSLNVDLSRIHSIN